MQEDQGDLSVNIALKGGSLHFTPRQEDSVVPGIYLNKSSLKLLKKREVH